MKKFSALILTAALLLSLAACGGGNKKAFTASKEAYENINSAYEIVEDFGSDIYEAWRMGIYDQKEDDFSLAFLAKKLKLTEEDLKIGLAYLLNDDEWDSLTATEKQEKAAESDPTLIEICNALKISADFVLSAYITVDTPIRWTPLAEKLDGVDLEKQRKIETILNCLIKTI